MMKPKVALVKAGFLPAGSENVRGRLSLAAIEKCKELAAEGWQIEGYATSQTKDIKSGESKTVVTKEKVIHNSSEVVEPRYRFGQDAVNTHEAVTRDGRVYDMRQACRCGYSLNGCMCNEPAILTEKMIGHETVTIRLKKIKA